MMADVAQLVRALVCGTRCREFESLHPPHIKKARRKMGFFYYRFMKNLAQLLTIIDTIINNYVYNL